MRKIEVIDSHTEGEPTRVVVAGGPDLGPGPITEKVKRFRSEFDQFRAAIVNEPRGSDVLVGTLLFPPSDPNHAAGTIFFNNVGCLGMCGHGTIGVMATLSYLGKITHGSHAIETPVGTVRATLHENGNISVTNVASYRKAKDVLIHVHGIGAVKGDVAWGGNWFFLIEQHGQQLDIRNVEQLTEFAWQIRQAVNAQGYPEIDHIELFGPPQHAHAHSRNFVLCPGKAYDRSPCGTGTSAKLACLAADQKLQPNELWVQESIIGSQFTGSYQRHGDQIIPTITGRAYITAQSVLLLDEHDPFCWGIPKRP